MAWETDDRGLTPAAAAERFAADTFEERRTVRDLAGGFGPGYGSEPFGKWTFRLEGGTQVYAMEWTGRKWRVWAEIMPV